MSDAVEKEEALDLSILKKYVNGERVPTTVNLIKQEERTLETINRMFAERIGELTSHVKDRLYEYANYIRVARDSIGRDDWFNWMHQGIMTVANKTTVDQRNIAYLIGIYKAWLSNGFGTYHGAEVMKLRDVFKQLYGVDPSSSALKVLDEMIQDYGLVYAVTALHSCPKETNLDMSAMYAEQCKSYLKENYVKIGG